MNNGTDIPISTLDFGAFQNYYLFSRKYHRLKKVVDKSKLLHIDETHKEEKYKPRALCYYFSSSGFEIVYLYKSSKLYTRSISFVLIDSPHDNWCFALIDSPPSSAPTWPAFRTTQATRTSRSSQTIGLYMSAPSQLRDGGQTNPTACQSFPSAYSQGSSSPLRYFNSAWQMSTKSQQVSVL